MRQYETGFVLSPTLSEEETAQFVQQMSEVIAQKKGRMVKQDIWGKRRLAFPIKRFQEGVYVFFTYEGAGDISTELERRFKQTDSVIRFMTVLRDPRDLIGRKRKKRAGEPVRVADEPAVEPAVEPAAEPAAEQAVEQAAPVPAEVKEET